MNLPAKSPQHKEMEEWLVEINRDERLQWLMSELWKPGSAVQRLLSLPRERLLPRASKLLRAPVPSFIDFRLPYFPYATPISYEVRPEAVAPTDTSEMEAGEGSDEEALTDAFEDREMERLIAHGAILAFRNNPSLMRCVTAETYDYPMLLRETKDLTDVNLDFLKDTDFLEKAQGSRLLRMEPGDTDAALLLKRAFRTFLEPFVENPLFLLRLFGEKLDTLGGVQSFVRDKLAEYLKFLGIQYEVYTEALRQLGEHGLLENYGTVIVCPSCTREGRPAVLFSFSHLTVGNLSLTCMRCGSTTEVAILYGLDDALYELIDWPDGAAAPALAWWLEGHSIPWRYSVPFATGECDFFIVAQGSATAIELKMLDLQSRTVSRRVREGIEQLESARQVLSAETAWLAINATQDFVDAQVRDPETRRRCEGWNISIAPVWKLAERLV